MPSLLLNLILRFLPYIAIGALLLGAWLYVGHLRQALQTSRADNLAQTTELDQLQTINAANVASIARLEQDQGIWQAASSTAQDQSDRIAKAASNIDQTVTAQPASQNAPIAPVLATTLDQLRQAQSQAGAK